MTPRPVVGVDLGGTTTTAGLVEGGEVLHTVAAPTPAQAGPDAVLATVTRLATTLCTYAASAHLPAPTHLGVGSAGVVDPASGTILAATTHLRDWAGTPVRARLAASTGLDIAVVNDVHAHALGEALHGAGRGRSPVLVVAAGTGLGGALVLDGHVVVGAHAAAGHLGHVPAPEAVGMACACGGAGHLECVASGDGLVALAGAHGIRARDGRAVVALADSGDVRARACVDTSARALGAAIGGWVGVLDPAVVVVTGGLARAGERWWAGLREAATASVMPRLRDTPLVPAGLGPDSAVVGAASCTR